MKRSPRTLRFRALLCAAAVTCVSACFIDAGSVSGKQCRNQVDCPEPYTCVAVYTSGPRTCEVLRGPDSAPPAGGGPYDYCKDVRPLLNKSCVANCHGTDTSGSSQSTFRLDAYSFSSGFPLGAFAKASRIRVRVSSDDMPPPNFSPRLTADERTIVTRWVDLGSVECLGTDPMPMVDAGGGSDGGNTQG